MSNLRPPTAGPWPRWGIEMSPLAIILMLNLITPCNACGELHIATNRAHVCADCADTDMGCELIHETED